MSVRATDVAVAQALATVVREGGSAVPGEARRVQGMMSDVLGSEARTRRAEVDAVVVAVEEGIPEDLLAERIDPIAAIDRMRERGLDLDVARFAVEVWQYALGQLEADAPPPSLTNSLERPITDPAPEVIGTVLPPGPADIDPRPVPNPADPAPVSSSSSRRRVAIGASLAVAAGLVIALVAALVLRSDGQSVDAPDPGPGSGSVSRDRPTVRFAAQESSLGEVQRTWRADGDTVVSTLTFRNDTEAAVSGRHIEVVPKSMAASASQITSEPAHTVLVDDPVIAWDLTIEPGDTVEVVSRIEVGDDVDLSAQRLAEWKDDHHAAEVELAAERSSPPALSVSSPTQGQVVGSNDFAIYGTTEPGAKLTISGTEVPVGADGGWKHEATGFPSGKHTLEVTATDVFGTTNQVAVSFTVFVPPAVPEPSVTPPGTTSGPKATTTKPKTPTPTPTPTPEPTPDPTPTPQPVANRSPVKRYDPTFPATAIQPCGVLDTWYIYVLQQFSDPDGDPLTVTSVGASSGSATVAQRNGQSSVHYVEPDDWFSGKAYVSFTVSDGRGGTTSGMLTITVTKQSGAC